MILGMYSFGATMHDVMQERQLHTTVVSILPHKREGFIKS